MSPRDLLEKGFGILGIEHTAEQTDHFMHYLSEIITWNRAYSLTSLKTEREIVIKHFLDSCLYLKALDNSVGSLADVGSGAGLPGIPVKILRPEISVSLIESVGKKAAFLRNVIRSLGLGGAEVVENRVENISNMEVDAAVTRALFRVEEFYERAGHIVRAGGRLILSKGPRANGELEEVKTVYEITSLALPFTDIKRNIIVLRKE